MVETYLRKVKLCFHGYLKHNVGKNDVNLPWQGGGSVRGLLSDSRGEWWWLLVLGFSHASSESAPSWSADPGTADCLFLWIQNMGGGKWCTGSNVTNRIDFKTHLPFFASPISSFSEAFGKRIVIDFQLCDLQRKKQIEKSIGLALFLSTALRGVWRLFTEVSN